MNKETRNCQKCHSNFDLDQNDLSFYEKMKVPAPNVCPDCRFKMRAIWRNETALYTGVVCGLCRKSMVSMYNPDSGNLVYCDKCYVSDSWDPKDYATDYDVSRPFFEQYGELLKKVPKNHRYVTLSSGAVVNSDYCNCFGGSKNCFFLFNGGPAEDVIYSRGLRDARECSDGYFGVKLDQCYETINVQYSTKVWYSQNVTNSLDSFFLFNCSNLTECFGCVSLKNKSNCFFNEQLSKEDYKAKVSDILGSYKAIEKYKVLFDEFKLKFPHRESNNLKCANSSGEYLYECNDVQNSFEVTNSENSKHLFSVKYNRDSSGVVGFGFKSELLCEVVSTGYSSRVMGSYAIDLGQDIMYSFSCYPNNHDLVGCVGLKNSEYCILNQQYTKEEYKKLKDHIVGELTELGIHGLMIPPELSPFAYNETIAQDNMPLTKEEALAQGYRWEDDIQKTEGKETLKPENIPDHIKDVPNDFTKEILSCIDCNRNYKITEQELMFYRKMILPIPRKCFYCRHKDRITRRGPYKFWNRYCAKCSKDIVTNYSPVRPEIVYCEKCYQQEVY